MGQIIGTFEKISSRVLGATEENPKTLLVLSVLLALAVVNALFWLIVGLNQPIADLHQFRQTQTAISAYWIWRGGPWLAYETPVLGYPWSIPFEFPIYQYLMAALRVVGISLEAGGRLISFAFYLGLLWPLRVLLKNLGLGRTDYLILSILLMTSPLYVYWSRTVMIESCALFFGFAWFAFLIQFLRTSSWRDAVLATGFGILAMLTKVTTFPGFGIIGVVAAVAAAWQMYRHGLSKQDVGKLLAVACIGLAPLACELAWATYSDHVKEQNILGLSLTSAALSGWNFGTLEQRLSSDFWQATIMKRIFPDVLGLGWIVGLIVFAGVVRSTRYAVPLGLAVLGFLTPMLLFTNLHMVHNYYQYANGVFLLAAVGFGLAAIAHSGWRVLCVVLLFLVVIGEIVYFNAGFARAIQADASKNRQIQIALLAKSMTQPDQALLIFGDDWSPAIAYEAERKAIMVPNWAEPQTVRRILNNPEDYLGGVKLGAAIYCAGPERQYLANLQDLQAFFSIRTALGDAGGCRLFSAAPLS